ncbi:hypothetical protein BCR32DRAFT_286283 [Anaeromyces robustus]|uniref:Uncharacterized protein n=1 Tax=Anaeromyces robustus TaxID=1754192 RepID=A0A1Y1W070_9FUNG|nr:hypothetical protein BCR32DRAFT_286283 [Anaeromyces robustus]|eukprot:ORX66685.1 hypothetical protein BCR32DRAFT_286283 [Anaeromyces robustus]
MNLLPVLEVKFIGPFGKFQRRKNHHELCQQLSLRFRRLFHGKINGYWINLNPNINSIEINYNLKTTDKELLAVKKKIKSSCIFYCFIVFLCNLNSVISTLDKNLAIKNIDSDKPGILFRNSIKVSSDCRYNPAYESNFAEIRIMSEACPINDRTKIIYANYCDKSKWKRMDNMLAKVYKNEIKVDIIHKDYKLILTFLTNGDECTTQVEIIKGNSYQV